MRKRFMSVVLATMLVLGLPVALYAQCVSCSTIYSQAVSAANEKLSQCMSQYGPAYAQGCYAQYLGMVAGASAAYAACKLVPDCPA